MRFVLRCVGAFVLSLALLTPMMAQDQPPAAKKKVTQISGQVQNISKDTSTITLRKGTMDRQVVYNSETKFQMGSSRKHTPSSIDEVKQGNYMYCGGTEFQGVKLVATTCRFREQK